MQHEQEMVLSREMMIELFKTRITFFKRAAGV